MHRMVEWLESTFRAIPLPLLETWGRFSYLIGFALMLLAFGGFSLRLGTRWGFARERQAWDAKAFLAVPLTFSIVVLSGYLGSTIVLVPGAQTFESLKDLCVFVCVVLFGYPALITVPFAYGLSDLLEGVPPEFMLDWLAGYFINPSCFWIAYLLLGKAPDFRRAISWRRYALFVLAFMVLEPELWGYICSDKFTAEISYRTITPALFFTTSITWVLAPLAMLGSLPLARRFGMFWAEIPGHVKERPLGQREWVWESGSGDARVREPALAPVMPIRMLLVAPFIVLMLLMVAATAYVTLRSAEEEAERLAERLHLEISQNLNLRLNDYLEGVPGPSDAQHPFDLTQMLSSLDIAEHGRVARIMASGRHLLELINSVLEMSKIEAGRASLNAEVCDLPALLEDVRLMFEDLVQARGVALRFELDEGLPREVELDSGKLRQVMINLLSNAAKFTKRGAIEVSARAVEAQLIEVCVRDTGVGIERANLERIFDVFDQSESGARHGGTGLGLTISRSFARLMGGELTVESEPGRGSTFRFSFHARSAAREHALQLDNRPITIRLRKDHTPTVLVVDDELVNGELMQDVLAQLGFATRVASSGEQAMEAYAVWPADLILMDLRMPGMGGLEAIRRLRARGCGAQIIAFTASALAESEHEARAAGADDFMRKPYRERELLIKIASALGLPYELAAREVAPGPTSEYPALADLVGALPSELVEQLREATLQARVERIERLMERAEEHSAAAAAQLRTLARGYQYDALLAALEPRAG